MLNSRTIVHDLLMQLCYTRNEHRVFGRRFNGDKRYVIKPLCGCGNCARDEYIVNIGHYILQVVVNRKKLTSIEYPNGYYVASSFSVALCNGMNPVESTYMTHDIY